MRIKSEIPFEIHARHGKIVPAVSSKTSAAMAIYIDGGAGSDTTGDGSSGSPYATFDILERLPDVRDHVITIRPAAGTYTSFPEKFNTDKIVIDASGETYTNITGPFTVASVDRISGASGGIYLKSDLTVSGSPGWTPKAFKNAGYFIQMTSGNWDGKVIPIADNGADTIRVGYDANVFAPTDTFNIVDVPVKIEVAHAIEFTGTGKEVDYEAKAVFAGIGFYCSDDSLYAPFIMENVSLTTTFCRFKFAGDGYLGFVHAIDSSWNNGFISATLDNTDLNEFYCCATQLVPLDGVAPTGGDGQYDVYVRNTDLGAGLCIRRGVLVTTGVCNAYAIQASGVTCADKSAFWISESCLEDWDALALINGVELDSGANADVDSLYVEGCNMAVEVGFGSTCKASWLQGGNIVDDYAVHVGPIGHVYKMGANVTVVGAVGAIEFPATGYQVAAWPSDDVVTDGAGSSVIDI